MTETSAKILDAASRIYLDKGLAGLTMRAVAEQIGVSATALYRHYLDKEALVIALVDEGYRRFGEYQLRAVEAKTAQERMRAAGRAYVDFALENPGYYRLMFIMPPTLGGVDLPEHVRNRARAVFQTLADRIRECIAARLFPRSLDPDLLARSIWALSHGLVSLYLAGKWQGSEDQFRKFFGQSHEWLARGYLTEG